LIGIWAAIPPCEILASLLYYLYGYTYHSMNATLVASLDKKLHIGIHERNSHCHC